MAIAVFEADPDKISIMELAQIFAAPSHGEQGYAYHIVPSEMGQEHFMPGYRNKSGIIYMNGAKCSPDESRRLEKEGAGEKRSPQIRQTLGSGA